jgi:hypothetical protein
MRRLRRRRDRCKPCRPRSWMTREKLLGRFPTRRHAPMRLERPCSWTGLSRHGTAKGQKTQNLIPWNGRPEPEGCRTPSLPLVFEHRIDEGRTIARGHGCYRAHSRRLARRRHDGSPCRSSPAFARSRLDGHNHAPRESLPPRVVQQERWAWQGERPSSRAARDEVSPRVFGLLGQARNARRSEVLIRLEGARQ